MRKRDEVRVDAALSVLDQVPALLRTEREARGLSLRDAADQVGVPHTTLSRIEAGAGDHALSNVVAVLRWLR